jgi:hypothetical protein
MAKSISDLIMDYFEKHPKKDLKHAPVVDWVTEQFLKDNPEPPRDPWRAIRKLHQEGKLIKVRKEFIAMTLTASKKLPCSISLQKLKRQSLKEMIINVLYVGEDEKTVLKYVQTISSQRTKVVTILLITDKLYAWNITLSRRITHRQRRGKGISLKSTSRLLLMAIDGWWIFVNVFLNATTCIK